MSPALSFSVFRDKILDGTKKQTIRVPRQRPIKVGDKLYLYWKMRTKQNKFLREAVCTEVIPLRIYDNYISLTERKDDLVCTTFFTTKTEPENSWLERLAKADGFDSVKDFFDFFNQHYDLPLEFVIIKWGLI